MTANIADTLVKCRWFVCVFVLAMLMACTPAPDRIPLRNPDAPVASQVNVSMARLDGAWRVIASAGSTAPREVFTVNAQKPAIFRFDLGTDLPAQDLGQGRFKVRETDYWVHWMDPGNRIAVVGSPQGAFVWVAERKRGAGLRAAAQEILDFYGYSRDRIEVPQ